MGPLDKVFAAGEVADGVNRMAKELKPLDASKYDKILGNKIIKTPNVNGNLNASNKIIKTPNVNGNLNASNKIKKIASELKEVKEKKDNLFPLAMGVLLGAGAFNAAAHKNISAPLGVVGEGVKDFAERMPRKMMKKNPVTKHVQEVFKTVKSSSRKKQASEYEEEIIKIARLSSKISNAKLDDAKLMLRQDFLRPGLEAVPYFAAPAALSYAIGKDLNNNLRPVRGPEASSSKVVIDVPIEKKAAFKKKPIPPATGYRARKPDIDKNWGEWASQNLPSQALRGLGRAIFPATAIALIGRDIRRGMLDTSVMNNLPPVPEGHARLIVETNDPNGPYVKNMKKKV